MLAGLAAPDRRGRSLRCWAGEVGRRQIGGEIKRRAIAHAPACGQQAVVMRVGVAEDRAGEPRDDLAPAYRQQFSDQREALVSRRRHAGWPVEDRGSKRLWIERVRDLVAIFGIGPSIFLSP